MEADLKIALRDLISAHPAGVSTERLCKTLRHTPQELGDTFEQLIQSGEVISLAGIWLTPTSFTALADKVRATLAELHLANPKTQGFEIGSIAKLLGLPWGAKPLARFTDRMSDLGGIEAVENRVSLSDFQLELTTRQVALLARIIECLESEAVNTPSPQAMAQTLGMPRQAVEEILQLGRKSHSVVNLAENVYYTPAQLTALVERVCEWGKDKQFSPNELRDWLGSTRKYVHPLLEHLDAKGLTVKDGPLREIHLK